MDDDDDTRGLSEMDAAILDELMEGCQVIGWDLSYVYVNRAAAAHGRTTPEALRGRTMMQVYPGIEDTAMFAVLRRCLHERVPARMENEFVFPDGSAGWFELRFEPVPMGVFILSVDITARKQTEGALRSSRERYRELVECLEDPVFALDGRGRLTYISPVVQRFGLEPEQLLGRPLSSLYTPDDRQPAAALLEQARRHGSGSAELRLVDADGNLHHVRCCCRRVRHPTPGVQLTGVLYDITDQRQAEEQLRAAQRLEAVGRLAGGIAHDFNNLLSVVLTYASFAIEALPEDDPIRQDVDEIRQAGIRAAALTRQLLSFSRKQVVQPAVVNLGEIVAGIKPMLRRLVGEDVQLRVQTADDLGHVEADPGQIEQVLMNLVVNARDAMPEGGVLTLSTRNVELDETHGDARAVKSGAYVMLSVTDTGTGMDHATQARIFEPFFTTKDPEKGTGLGLPTVFGIVERSGGHIWVDSEVGRGTTFKLYFPRVFSPVQTRDGVVPRVVPSTGRQSILLVEDEDAVRAAATRILESAGYEVLAASSPEQAMRMCERHAEPVALLLTDVVMPGATGPDLARALSSRYPGMRVVYMSGHTDEIMIDHGLLESGTPLVVKPFGAAELTAKVHAALQGPATSAREDVS